MSKAPVLALLLTGCIVVPSIGEAGTPHGLRDLWQTRDAPPPFLRPGEATRTSVLLALGVPDGALQGGRLFVYAASSIEAWVLFASMYGRGLELPVGSDYLLLVGFDAQGRVQRLRFVHVGLKGTSEALAAAYAEFGFGGGQAR